MVSFICLLFSIPSSAPAAHYDNYTHSSSTQNNSPSSSQNPSNSSSSNNQIDAPLFPMLVNTIKSSTSDITDTQSVIQFGGSDFLMLDDDAESSHAHHDISEGGESSGRAGFSSSFSSAHHARAKAKVSWAGLISRLYLVMRLMCCVFFVIKKCTMP
jgi:hypothetical protein